MSNIIHEVKLKGFELIAFAQDISKQHSVDCVLWLSVDVLAQIYNGKEQGKIQNVQSRRKEAPESVTDLKTSSC